MKLLAAGTGGGVESRPTPHGVGGLKFDGGGGLGYGRRVPPLTGWVD